MSPDRRSVLRALAGAGTAATAGCFTGSPAVDSRTPRETVTPVDEPRGDGSTVGIQPVADGLTSPTQLVERPDGEGLYVADQVGTIHAIGRYGLEADPYLDYRGRVEVNSEKGLLGMAFHPSYPDDSRLFLRYSAPRREGTPADYSHTEVLVELEAPPEADTPRTETELTLMEFPSPTIYHQAGDISFGPDGYLYVTMGEGTKREFAQDLESNRLGAVHRIDVDGSSGDRPYAIPSDNPLVGTDGYPEYYAWGFRNPWRMSFNDGDLLVGDVGLYSWEEVDLVEKGANYGWPYREGPECTGWEDSGGDGRMCGVDPADVPGETFVDPVIAFPNSRTRDVDAGNVAGTAVIAGYVYERDGIVGLQDRYLFSNYTRDLGEPAGELYVADPTGEGDWPVTKFSVSNSPNGELNRVVNSMGRDANGHVYLLTVGVPDKEDRFAYGAGEVLQVVPPGTATTELALP